MEHESIEEALIILFNENSTPLEVTHFVGKTAISEGYLFWNDTRKERFSNSVTHAGCQRNFDNQLVGVVNISQQRFDSSIK